MSGKRNNRVILMLGLALLIMPACSSDDPASPSNSSPNHLVAPLENAVVDVPLAANQPTTVNLTLQLPPDIPLITAATIDIEGTLDHVTIDGISLWTLIARRAASLFGKADDLGATASLRVGYDPDTVCESGIFYGPFEISQGTSLVVSPAEVEADDATLEVINMGSMTVCLTIVPNFDCLLSVDSVAMDISEGNCDSPADFSGSWTGTYQCVNTCYQNEGGDIELTVTQDGTQASYTDNGGYTFEGVVCGDMFRFEYSGEEYVERGTLTLDSPTTATKRSTWRSVTPPYCGGNCVDYLTRGGGGGDCPTLTITSGPPPDGAVGVSYFYQLTTSGGQGTVARWAIPDDLIPGLEYQENGILSGTPEAGAAGTWSISLTAYDQCPSDVQLINQTHTITISN